MSRPVSRLRARRAAKRYGIDTRPISNADIERARSFVREQGWLHSLPPVPSPERSDK